VVPHADYYTGLQSIVRVGCELCSLPYYIIYSLINVKVILYILFGEGRKVILYILFGEGRKVILYILLGEGRKVILYILFDQCKGGNIYTRDVHQ